MVPLIEIGSANILMQSERIASNFAVFLDSNYYVVRPISEGSKTLSLRSDSLTGFEGRVGVAEEGGGGTVSAIDSKSERDSV